MKKIDFETHFATQEWIDALYQNKAYPRLEENKEKKTRRLYFTETAVEPFSDVLLGRLLDTGANRIKDMDEAGIDMQVLSLTAPGVEQFDPKIGARLAQQSNDALAEIIGQHPERFTGFAALPAKDPDAAVQELQRAVKDLGLIGWKTHSNYGDAYLDDKRFWPILAKAEELDVPIYLHPTAPMISQLQTYGFALAGAPFGFGVETAMVMMRLILSGVFDTFPNLKIILGHLGEGLPFVLQRIDFPYVRPHFKNDPGARPDLNRKPSEYLRHNMWVTTSGNYLQPAFMCTKEVLGIDRILLSTDYPYEDAGECMQFLDSLPLSATEKEKIYHQNARAFGLTA
jgi:predicted TIM-barrel fold metal-dependent hydrolase